MKQRKTIVNESIYKIKKDFNHEEIGILLYNIILDLYYQYYQDKSCNDSSSDNDSCIQYSVKKILGNYYDEYFDISLYKILIDNQNKNSISGQDEIDIYHIDLEIKIKNEEFIITVKTKDLEEFDDMNFEEDEEEEDEEED